MGIGNSGVLHLASIIPLESVVMKDSVTFDDVLVDILDQNNEVASFKVLWSSPLID